MRLPDLSPFQALTSATSAVSERSMDVLLAVEFARLLALGHDRAVARLACRTPGMPAPPARSFSASVPCGVNSSSSSPARYWRSNSLFSPT